MTNDQIKNAIEQLQEDAEVRLTFQEAEIQQLNLTVNRQHQAIQTLNEKVKYLYQQLQKVDSLGIDSSGEETPPHY